MFKARFAPSPTGYLHVGGARTALFNWLVVQKEKRTDSEAKFVLRIEDTDNQRNKPEWTQGIIDALLKLGLNWDEGPIFQSSRIEVHKQTAYKLLDANFAYWCNCTKENIEDRNRQSKFVGYDRHCRDLGLQYQSGYALRFKVPLHSTSKFHDLIRGDVEIENSTLEDFVLLKSDLTPLFVLANTVDDMDLKITHVIRGEEHLYNTFKIILLWNAISSVNSDSSNLNATGSIPTFAHLPLLVNKNRQKLSKRRDQVSVEEFFDSGYLPEAMVNYLALLGWGTKNDREILTVEELIDQFDLKDVNLAPAFFDVQKLTHFNNIYLRDMPKANFYDRALTYLKDHTDIDISKYDRPSIEHMLDLIQPRIDTLKDIEVMIGFFLKDNIEIPDELFNKIYSDSSNRQILTEFFEVIKTLDFKTEILHNTLETIGLKFNKKLSKSQAPIRIAVTGSSIGPPLFESLVILGRDKTLARLDKVSDRFGR